MEKQRTKIIRDSKQRGEWAESVFRRGRRRMDCRSASHLANRIALIAWWGVRGSLLGCR